MSHTRRNRLPCRSALSPEDRAHLAALDRQLQLVRDRVRGVVSGLSTGLYLWGPGAAGKSHTVLGELARLRADHVVLNSCATGRGLFDRLAERPDSVFVLEDMEPLLHDRNAQGVLRSALWAQAGPGGHRERRVTWSHHRQRSSFLFGGGIIITANRPLDHWPELEAIRTRIASIHLRPTPDQTTALMRQVASGGRVVQGVRLSALVCSEVCEFLIEESRAVEHPLDMRLLVHAFSDYAQFMRDESGCGWRDLVASRLRERPGHFREPVRVGVREQDRQRQAEQARAIRAETDDRKVQVALWRQRTGRSPATFYRALALPAEARPNANEVK